LRYLEQVKFGTGDCLQAWDKSWTLNSSRLNVIIVGKREV